MLDQILSELKRVNACDVHVTMYKNPDPAAETLVRVDIDHAYWHLVPERFLKMLKQLGLHAGNEAVRLAIETNEMLAWRDALKEPQKNTPHDAHDLN